MMLTILYYIILVDAIYISNQNIFGVPISSIVPSRYTVDTTFFQQSNSDTDDETFDITKDFGLNTNVSWDNVVHNITARNIASPGSKFKLLFLQRHGEGFHNVATGLYDNREWKCHWQSLPGNGDIEWYDAELTNKGRAQVQLISDAWGVEISNNHAPIPQTYYTSPLRRCLETHELIWGTQARPVVKENARETYGIGMESKRHSKVYLQTRFPYAIFESNFLEEDLLWNATHHESKEHRHYRATVLLNEIFSQDDSLVISITSHSGLISSILHVIGHRKWSLGTGQMIPVVIEASSFTEYVPPTLTKPWKTLNCKEKN